MIDSYRNASGSLTVAGLNAALSRDQQEAEGGALALHLGGATAPLEGLRPQSGFHPSQLYQVLQLQAGRIHGTASQLLQEALQSAAGPVAIQAVLLLDVGPVCLWET